MRATFADLLAAVGVVLIIATVAAKAGGWWAVGCAGLFLLLGGSRLAVAEPPAKPKDSGR